MHSAQGTSELSHFYLTGAVKFWREIAWLGSSGLVQCVLAVRKHILKQGGICGDFRRAHVPQKCPHYYGTSAAKYRRKGFSMYSIYIIEVMTSLQRGNIKKKRKKNAITIDCTVIHSIMLHKLSVSLLIWKNPGK